MTDIRIQGDHGVDEWLAPIGGEWRRSETLEAFDVMNPATGHRVHRVQKCTAADVLDAVDGAYRWVNEGGVSPVERLEIMDAAAHLVRQHAGELAMTITVESGKPISSARKEVEATVERLELSREDTLALRGEYIPGEWTKETAGKYALVSRRPLGVVAALSPFNYPLFIGAAKIIPALLGGNGVVVKPPSDAPLSLLLFAKILYEAGLPPRALSVVPGSGSEIGDPLVQSRHVAGISFTGSTTVGQSIAAKAPLKKVHLELGGKAAAIVCEDADVALAAKRICKGTFSNSGQRCDAVSRVLVHEKVKSLFVEAVLGEVAQYRCGDPMNENTVLGPLINESAAQKVERLVADAKSKGASVLAGGGRDGLFHEATVLDQVSTVMDVAVDEIFGPVMPIMTVENDQTALETANASEYGLDSCVFTGNIDRARWLAGELQDGSVTVNGVPRHGIGVFPFGGDKRSGVGREGLKYSIDEFTRLHTVVFQS